MEAGKEVVVEGEVVEARELVELVLVEGGEPAPGQHQVGQLGQGAREPGSQGVREPGSQGVRESGSQGAR